MTAKEIENELNSQGYDVDGVVARDPERIFFAVGWQASDLPDDVLGYQSRDDPNS